MNIISNNQMARHLLTLVFAVLMAFSAAYAEKVATPRGDAVSGTGSSNCARFTPQEVICDPRERLFVMRFMNGEELRHRK